MKLSVVIPCYNSAGTIGDQLEALAQQRWHQPWEVIVADNGSTDDSKAVVERHCQRLPNLRWVNASGRRGPSHARNVGVKAARGESIAFCDADDVVGDNWVAAMGDALGTHELIACRVDLRKLNPDWMPGLDDHPQLRGLEQAPYPPYLLNAGGGTIGIRKHLYASVGGFDEFFVCLQDHDFCFRLARAGARIRYVKDAVLHIRNRPKVSGMFKQARKWGTWNVAVFKRHRAPGRSHLWCWRLYLKDCVKHIVRLPSIRTRRDVAGWMWQSGLLIGLLWGSIRFRSAPGPFFSFTYVEGSKSNEYEPGTIPAAPSHGIVGRMIRKPVYHLLRRWLGTISHVKTSEPIAALTFDDGPDPVATPRVLEILRRHGARATFFMVGESARTHPDLVRRVAEDGHVIANHSWDHPSFPSLQSCDRREQLRACARVTAPNGSRLFRPPYGEQDLASRFDAWRLGYKVVTWSVDGWDWCETDPRRVVDSVTQKIQPGSILLFHDHIFRTSRKAKEGVGGRPSVHDRSAMLEALEMILEQLGNRFRFVTVPELLARGEPVKRNWFVTKPSDWDRLGVQH